VDVHLGGRSLGRLVAPQVVDQTVTRHHAVRLEQQARQQGPPFRAAELEKTVLGVHLERSKQPKVHVARILRRPAPGANYART
jgi:hypothetical protein